MDINKAKQTRGQVKMTFAFQVKCGDRYYWVKNGNGYFDYIPVKVIVFAKGRGYKHRYMICADNGRMDNVFSNLYGNTNPILIGSLDAVKKQLTKINAEYTCPKLQEPTLF